MPERITEYGRLNAAFHAACVSVMGMLGGRVPSLHLLEREARQEATLHLRSLSTSIQTAILSLSASPFHLRSLKPWTQPRDASHSWTQPRDASHSPDSINLTPDYRGINVIPLPESVSSALQEATALMDNASAALADLARFHDSQVEAQRALRGSLFALSALAQLAFVTIQHCSSEESILSSSSVKKYQTPKQSAEAICERMAAEQVVWAALFLPLFLALPVGTNPHTSQSSVLGNGAVSLPRPFLKAFGAAEAAATAVHIDFETSPYLSTNFELLYFTAQDVLWAALDTARGREGRPVGWKRRIQDGYMTALRYTRRKLKTSWNLKRRGLRTLVTVAQTLSPALMLVGWGPLGTIGVNVLINAAGMYIRDAEQKY